MKRKKIPWIGVIKGLLIPVAAVVVLLFLSTALNSLDGGQSAENLRQLEDILRRNSIACYAVEGVYPPNLEYLKTQYGVQIDETRYTVYYDIFAENLMPNITVLENKP